jgi:hypothetical protein
MTELTRDCESQIFAAVISNLRGWFRLEFLNRSSDMKKNIMTVCSFYPQL